MASPTDHDNNPQAGDAAPDFTAASSRAQTLDESRFIGKVPFVLVFTSDLQDPGSARLVNDLDRHQEGFGSQRVQLLIVVPEPVDLVQQDSDQRSITAPLLADPGREIAARYGVELDGTGFEAVVVDREGVVVERLALIGEHAAERLVEEVRRIVAEHPWSMEPASRD
jgi:peroxiredoxin Q/BCP